VIRTLKTFWNLHRIAILLVILGLIFYGVFGYELVRTDSVRLVALYAALFFLTYKLIQFEKWNLRFIVTAGLLFRAVLLYALPNLSQDFYRFIWDGTLILEGLNPYLNTPDQWMAQGGLAFETASELHAGMGNLSRENYSNYPPVHQYFFALCVYLGGKTILGSVISMRVMIILADLGILYFGRRILKKINRAPNLIFWYFLNPLVIIELTGNLHFEGVMLFFYVVAMYLILSGKWFLSVLPYALSIGIKLIPLLFLPLLLPLLGWKKALGFYLGVALILGAFLYPLYFPEFSDHYSQTLRLWFSNFEFNASVYNIAEWAAVLQGAKPWEFIEQYGAVVPALTALVTLIVCTHPILKMPKYWFGGALVVICVYYFLATTVHPWYVIFPLLLSTFTNFKFMYFWSATVILSYIAYSGEIVEERSWVLFLEYASVFGFLIYELIRNKRNLAAIAKNQVRTPSD
jgi:hypothetical protein